MKAITGGLAALALAAASLTITTSPAWAAPLPVRAAPAAPAVVMNDDGRLEVFVVGTDQTVYHAWSDGQDQSRWTGWSKLEGRLVTAPLAVARNRDGSLEVFARDINQSVVHIRRNCLFGTWCEWRSLGGGSSRNAPVAIRTGDGSVEVFVRGLDDQLWHTSQTGTGTDDWAGWLPVFSPPANPPMGGQLTAIQQQNGEPEVYFNGRDDQQIHHTVKSGGRFSAPARVDSLTTGHHPRPAVANYVKTLPNGGTTRMPTVAVQTTQATMVSQLSLTSSGQRFFTPWTKAAGGPLLLEDMDATTDLSGSGAAVMYARLNIHPFTYWRQRNEDGVIGNWRRLQLPAPGLEFISSPAVSTTYDFGPHYVFGVQSDGQVYFAHETRRFQEEWSAWQRIG